jgi:site-specific DNA-methyltransferase (adenine-specific)
MTPYYSSNGITIYNCDCREILPSLEFDLVISDPPYGISHPTDFKARGRGKLANCSNYSKVFDDDKPFSPEQILSFGKPTCLFGANYFSKSLPESSGWLVWDKLRPDDLDQSTCELAWTNFVKGVRRFKFMWNGMIRKGDDYLEHPTQKPVELFSWILGLRWTPAGTVIDPYMGSGPVMRASKDLGRKAIGIEICEKYCEIAARRLQQEVLAL